VRVQLHPHPDTPCAARAPREAEAARDGPGLSLRYVLTGDLGRLRIPPRALAERADELWRRTCFEAFAAGEGGGYSEFNFSPSTQWAAYRFEGYRRGMTPLEMAPPQIQVRQGDERLELSARLMLPTFRRLGLAAVIEEADGRISYWAVQHAAGKPDFHHPDCLAFELPAPDAP
jgi:hypothetical protein